MGTDSMSDARTTRREFIHTVGVAAAYGAAKRAIGDEDRAGRRPNILWIVSEDNGPFLGCYGDTYATTPNLDRLADEGVLYPHAYANAPVCAPARCTIISGMYPTSLGTQHMRSQYEAPAHVRMFPQYLRDAGYYCTNNAKRDYNRPQPDGVWDESSREATYLNRAKDQPFFSVFNIGISHESSLHKTADELDHDAAKAPLPPYHPDTPEIRHDWAQYYDKITAMDARVGELLAELDEAGLADDTIVFYYADHGGVLPRSKRFLYDTGIHVPFIVRLPEPFQHLSPDGSGTETSRLVSFVDLAPTILSLAGVPVPDHMQGDAFLGEQTADAPEYVSSFRGRMDERYDLSHSVHGGRYHYIRNYHPHRIYGQHLRYLWRAPSTRSWELEYTEGRCNKAQSRFWERKPSEELYDTHADPSEVTNLAALPEHRERLETMRRAEEEWAASTRTTSYLPEGEMIDRSLGTTAHAAVREPSYPFDQVATMARLASEGDVENLAAFEKAASDPEAAVRYWAAMGWLILGEEAATGRESLGALLRDSSGDVRVVAAEAVCLLGEPKRGLSVLTQELRNENGKTGLAAMNALEALGDIADPALAAVREIAVLEGADNYLVRAAETFIERRQT